MVKVSPGIKVETFQVVVVLNITNGTGSAVLALIKAANIPKIIEEKLENLATCTESAFRQDSRLTSHDLFLTYTIIMNSRALVRKRVGWLVEMFICGVTEVLRMNLETGISEGFQSKLEGWGRVAVLKGCTVTKLPPVILNCVEAVE